jgi:hypothetical protein
MFRMLDTQLLIELEQSWKDAGALYLGDMRPGLTDADINQRIAQLGFDLPEEAWRWYRWHDGSSDHYVTSFRIMTSLAEDVDETMTLQSNDPTWPPGWLKAMNEQPYVIFDCRGAIDTPVPVWHYYQGLVFPTRPLFKSIGDMIMSWIRLINEGHMLWSVDRGWYLRDPCRLRYSSCSAAFPVIRNGSAQRVRSPRLIQRRRRQSPRPTDPIRPCPECSTTGFSTT